MCQQNQRSSLDLTVNVHAAQELDSTVTRQSRADDFYKHVVVENDGLLLLASSLRGRQSQTSGVGLVTAMFQGSVRCFLLMTLSVLTCTFFSDVICDSGAVFEMSASEQPEVTLDDGTILLGLLETLGERQVATFRGVPYAVPPVGPLRFKKPVGLMSPDVTQFNATQYGPACFSVPPAESQSEDCLYLNVWVPVGGPTQPPFSVMVRIHGGGFYLGDGTFPAGDRLAAQNNVIVISINYRLGPLGFLSTGDSASVGNYGLWDQHTALLWVQRNIAAFGGDPGAVTLMGESAGGMCVSFHMASPHSCSLFHRAILQSGSLYCPTALQWTPVEKALGLGRAVDCDHSAHDDMVDCLRNIPASVIADASASLWLADAVRTIIDFGWAPVEDGDFVPQLYAKNGTLLPLPSSSSPSTTAFNGPVFIGVGNNEGSVYKTWRYPLVVQPDGEPNIEAKLFNPDFFAEKVMTRVMQQLFKALPEDTPAFSTAAQVVAYEYRDWASGLSTLTRSDLNAALGDSAFVSPVFQFVRQWMRSGRDQVYVYVLDNYPDIPAENGMEGINHGVDTFYAYGYVDFYLRIFSASEAVIAKEMKLSEDYMKLLSNFAKSGNPAVPRTLLHWPAWPLFNPHNQTYLAISSTPRIATRYRAENVILWMDLVPAIVTRQPVTCLEKPNKERDFCDRIELSAQSDVSDSRCDLG